MATEILSTGSTAANSSDVVIAEGGALTVCLKGAAAGSAVVISLKDDGSSYNVIGVINSQNPSVLISAAGTYRFTRIAGSACGVFSA